MNKSCKRTQIPSGNDTYYVVKCSNCTCFEVDSLDSEYKRLKELDVIEDE